MRIYVASSWRSDRQPSVVLALREAGHEVYDFRNPSVQGPGAIGVDGAGSAFHWRDIDATWEKWTGPQMRLALLHPLAIAGFLSDFRAMQWADVVVMVLPCGRSAHLELGWAAGAGKRTAALLAESQEPELMYRMVDLLAVRIEEVMRWLDELPSSPPDVDNVGAKQEGSLGQRLGFRPVFGRTHGYNGQEHR